MLQTIIYANMLPLITMVALMIFVSINPLFDKKQNKLFFQAAALVVVMIIAISVDYLFSESTFEYSWLVRRITSFLSFSGACIVPILLIRIFTNKRLSKWIYLPAVFNLCICVISMFVRLVFYVSVEGGYGRGPLFFVPFTITMFYIAFLLLLSFKNRQERVHEALLLFLIVLGLALAMSLEILFYFRFLLWDFTAIFFALYYLLLNINKSMLDPLTSAFNRAMYTKKLEKINHDERCAIAMIDINGFKAVNDTKGHSEGDRILILFTKTVKAYMNKNNVLYRIGGDEFVVLSNECSVEKLQSRMGKCFKELEQFDIHCAVGYELYDCIDDIEIALHTADLNMYQNKQEYYLNSKTS